MSFEVFNGVLTPEEGSQRMLRNISGLRRAWVMGTVGLCLSWYHIDFEPKTTPFVLSYAQGATTFFVLHAQWWDGSWTS